MSKYILILIVAALFTSCVTQKKCISKYPPEIIRERYDSIIIKDTIIYKDRIVPLIIKGDTITVEKQVPGYIDISAIRVDNSYAYASAWVQNSKLKLSLIQKEQVINFRLDSADKISRHWQFQYIKEKESKSQIIREKYVPKITKVLSWIGTGGLIFLFTWLYFKIKGGWLKSLLK